MAKLNPNLLVLLLAVPALGCPDLWTPVGDSCYKTSSDPLSWYDAQQHCGQEGGYLIEISDADEQASLPSFLPGDIYYWLGLTDLAEEGTFMWQTDYTEANYTFWASGQPDNHDGVEDCGHLWINFQWNDVGCDLTSIDGVLVHALCERENED